MKSVMKKMLTVTMSLSLLMLFSGMALAGDNPFILKAPGFKTAIIQYKMAGSASGKATLYIDGLKQAKHIDSVTKIFGMSTETKTISITTPDKVVTVDLKEKTATATGNPMKYMAQEYEKLNTEEKKRVRANAENMGASIMSGMGAGKPEIKKGDFKGKPVDIVTVMGFTTYTWRGTNVPLKVNGSIMGVTTDEEATNIKTGGSIPSDAMKVPAGITERFDQQADQQMRQMAKNWIEMLKDPNFGKEGSGSSVNLFKGMGLDKPPADSQEAKDTQEAKETAEQKNDETKKGEEDSLDPALKQGMKILKGIFN